MALYADAYLKKMSNGFEYLNNWSQIRLLLMKIVLCKQTKKDIIINYSLIWIGCKSMKYIFFILNYLFYD